MAEALEEWDLAGLSSRGIADVSVTRSELQDGDQSRATQCLQRPVEVFIDVHDPIGWM
jgi:hypothetical protein